MRLPADLWDFSGGVRGALGLPRGGQWGGGAYSGPRGHWAPWAKRVLTPFALDPRSQGVGFQRRFGVMTRSHLFITFLCNCMGAPCCVTQAVRQIVQTLSSQCCHTFMPLCGHHPKCLPNCGWLVVLLLCIATRMRVGRRRGGWKKKLEFNSIATSQHVAEILDR